MMNRREIYRVGTLALGGLMGLMLAVPGLSYLLSPILRKKDDKGGDFQTLARLSQLAEGVPQAFAVIDERQDAWVKYPREPIGSVWLIRQPSGSNPEVVAFTAECPHLGCAVGLAGDGKSFLCPCHDSNFEFTGEPRNKIPPRPMDSLEVKLSTDPDPEVRVKFQQFRTASEEKKPLV
jgi:menaquinol-cytochrome c reductase iron-sulfur subunit